MAKGNHANESEGKKKPSVIKIILFVVGGLILLGLILPDSKSPSSSSNNNTNNTSQNQNKTSEEPKIEYKKVNISSFAKEFDDNQITAQKKYSDKYIETTGYINDISEDILGKAYLTLKPSNQDLYFGTQIQCYVKDDKELDGVKTGKKVTIRGQVQNQFITNIGVNDCEVL